MVSICLKNKRTTEIEPINNIIFDPNYLNELHQIECCLLGMLANNQRNDVIYSNYIGLANMKRLQNTNYLRNHKPLLEISSQYVNNFNEDIVVLKPKYANNLLPFKILDLINNDDLLSNLSKQDALSIGYTASDFLLKDAKWKL
jgi:hypothetical protein